MTIAKPAPPERAVTPQVMVFTVLGLYSLQDDFPISTTAYVDILGRAGVSEHAVRMTLNRMAEREFIQRERSGRSVLWSAAARGRSIVGLQHERTFSEFAATPDPNGPWTIVTFSIPESRRRDRDVLRNRLAWAGFGPLRDGVWVSPGDRDLSSITNDIWEERFDEYAEAFTAIPKLVDLRRMIAKTWPIFELNERYQRFLAMWDRETPAVDASDDLGRLIWLVSRWRRLVRETPQLPDKYLPNGWPANRCLELFHERVAAYTPEADRIMSELVGEPRSAWVTAFPTNPSSRSSR